jgi:hypothetical protein
MLSPHTVLAHGRAPSVRRRVGVRSELGWSRATRRFQPLVIDLLGEAVSTWHRATAVLKAESANLRAVAVRIPLTRTTVRLEVEDSGRRGVIAPGPPDPERGDGFGLRLVPALSERSGRKRVEGGSRVWAQLRRTRVSAPAATTNAPGDRGGGGLSQSRINQRAGGPTPATSAGGQP